MWIDFHVSGGATGPFDGVGIYQDQETFCSAPSEVVFPSPVDVDLSTGHSNPFIMERGGYLQLLIGGH